MDSKIEKPVSVDILNEYNKYKERGWAPHIVYNAHKDAHFVTIFASKQFTESFMMFKVIV